MADQFGKESFFIIRDIDSLLLIGDCPFHARYIRRYQPVAKIVAVLVAGVIRFSNSIVGSSHATSTKGEKNSLVPERGSSRPKQKVPAQVPSGTLTRLGGHKKIFQNRNRRIGLPFFVSAFFIFHIQYRNTFEGS